MLLSLFSKFVLLGSALGAPSILLPPSQDPFYQPPSGYEDKPLGTILNHRLAPTPIRSTAFEVKIQNTWQLLVRSSDTFGNPNAIVTTVFEPYNADPSKLISYQVAQDAANVDCSPSFTFMDGQLFDTSVNQLEFYLIQTALNEGYYVVSPDYEGPKAAYTAGTQAAHAVLDSLRAVYNSSSITGINSDADTVIWGYSGGSLAGGWAAALQPTYAPELLPNLKGAAIGGWVTNVTATAVYEPMVNGGIFAGFPAAGIAGLSNEYPVLKAELEPEIFPLRYPQFSLAYDLCITPLVVAFAFSNFWDGPLRYFIKGEDALRLPEIADILNNNTLGLVPANMPQIPMFVFHGKIDALVPFDQAERVYNTWCEQGIESFEFAVDDTAGHISEVIVGSGAAFTWIKKILGGGAAVSGCQRTDRVTNLSYPGTTSFIGDFLDAFVKSIFGGDIGPNGENLQLTNGQITFKPNSTTSG